MLNFFLYLLMIRIRFLNFYYFFLIKIEGKKENNGSYILIDSEVKWIDEKLGIFIKKKKLYFYI